MATSETNPTPSPARTENGLPIAPAIESGTDVPLAQVDAELARQIKEARADLKTPVQLVRMSNLIVYCACSDELDRVSLEVSEIVADHPARVILLLGESGPVSREIQGSVLVRKVGERRGLVSEQISLRASNGSLGRLAFAVRKLLIGDLPTNLWWACPTAPGLAGPILDDLADHAQQLIFDSQGWENATRGISGTSSWLQKFERDASRGEWRIASDVNWRRLKPWRRLLTEGLDPSASPGLVTDLQEVVIEHGPGAGAQAWLIAGWLASRLGWSTTGPNARPDEPIRLQVQGKRGPITLKIDRNPDGPAEIRKIRVASGRPGQDGPSGVGFVSDGSGRLSVQAEGGDSTARTVAWQPRPIAGLVARQLSDREPDPIYRDSMRSAQALARRAVS